MPTCNLIYSNESKTNPNYIDVKAGRHFFRVSKSCDSCSHNTCPSQCAASGSKETEIGCSNWEWNERNGV
jgi:hypothetical protein